MFLVCIQLAIIDWHVIKVFQPHICTSYSYCLSFILLCHIADWVIQLGPPTYKGYFYQYAVVSNKCKTILFVLARNVTEFKQSYEEEVIAKLKELGFTRFHNKPRETYQESDCVYVW